MSVLIVTGTGTGVGKTVVAAAVAALAQERGASVVAVKPAEVGRADGEPGDLDRIASLSGVHETREFARFDATGSPAAAAQRCGRPPLDLATCAAPIATLRTSHDLVVVDTCGGFLTRYDRGTTTVAALAAGLTAPVLVVTDVASAAANRAALTVDAIRHRGLECAGIVVGSWSAQADDDAAAELFDIARLGVPIVGALPHGIGALDAAGFLVRAGAGLAPSLGGRFYATEFVRSAQQVGEDRVAVGDAQ
jgi:dethiobiotin synthetase